MYIFISILIVLASILLIGVVLIQKSKGGGLASDYSSGNQYLGYRKTTDFVEKATWSLAIFICVLSICAAFTVKTPITRSNIESAAPASTNAAPAPTTQTPAAPAPAAKPATEAAPAPAAKPAAEAAPAPTAKPATEAAAPAAAPASEKTAN